MKHFIFILAFFLIIPTQAKALSCVGPDIKRSLSGAEVIFEGRITEIDGILSHDKTNELTIVVEKPIKGVTQGEELTVYQQHWINRQADWKESKDDQKRGFFIMSKTPNKNTTVTFLIPQDIYFFGMCGHPMWQINAENKAAIDAFVKQENQP